MCIYGKMQIATCNNKQHVQADATCVLCNVCVLHRCTPSPASSLPLCLLHVTWLPRGFCRCCCCCLHGNLSSQRIAFNCNFATLQLQPLQRRHIPLQVTFQVQCLLDNNERNYAKRLVMRRMSSVVHTKCVCLCCHTHIRCCMQHKVKAQCTHNNWGKGPGKGKELSTVSSAAQLVKLHQLIKSKRSNEPKLTMGTQGQRRQTKQNNESNNNNGWA